MSAITEMGENPQASASVAPTTTTKSKYRPEIDGLRAFAVVAVIINHLNKDLLPSGYLGVDIFFVISGYVITSSLANRQSNNFWDFITGFYERRIKRLVPALAFFVLIMSILICLFNPDPGLALRSGIASLFGLSNLYLFKHSTDYFAQSTELNPFTHTWSLGVEEQFYLIFPFLIWFSGFGRQSKNGARNLFLWIGTLAVASLAGFVYLYQTNQPAAYFLMPSRFWEMAAGCLVFIGFQKRAKIEQALEKVPPLLVVAVMAAVMILPVHFAVPATISIVVLSAILIACLKNGTAGFALFTNKRVVYIGLISYSLYLWHWGVLSISRWTIGVKLWSVPLQVALMLGLALASYGLIETPLRKGAWFSNRWETLLFGAGALVAISGGLGTLEASKKYGFLYLGQKNKCIPFQYQTCNPPDAPHVALTPFVRGTQIQRETCFRYKGALTSEIAEKCSIRPEGSETTVYIVGSSYAHHMSPAFEKLRGEYGIGISYLVTPGCDLDPSFKTESNQLTCKKSNKFRWSYLLRNISSNDLLFTGPTGCSVNKEAVALIAEAAFKKGFDVIYHTPIPQWKRLPESIDAACQNNSNSQWFSYARKHDCATTSFMPKDQYIEKAASAIYFLRSLEKDNPFFHVFSIHDTLCGEKLCPSHAHGVRLYRDNIGHLSIHASSGAVYHSLKNFLNSKKLIKI